jgi:electron transport complex protein RnfB
LPNVTDANLIAKLDAVLPQTQCRQCGYSGCTPYAKAMAAGEAGANQCPPGGEEGARELAALLGVAYRPPDPQFGACKMPAVAFIDEARCIGCTLCIKACPVDAIVGAAKFMHTVIKNACTGCELCLPPCPVDCITMLTATPASRNERRAAARLSKTRYEMREARLARLRADAEQRTRQRATAAKKRRAVARAIARAQERIAKKTAAR